MKKLQVKLGERSYPIIIEGRDSFTGLAAEITSADLGTQAFIVTKPTIRRLFGRKLAAALKKKKIAAHFCLVKDSETSKSAAVYMRAVKEIAGLDTAKRVFCLALGGGVVGDLCGFLAATYKRGINYVQVPTTLLAQVDSAIGGKTAVDLPQGKNLIGAFYQPRLVYSNISLLRSLPKRQIRSGLAEVVKYGVIEDAGLFGFLEKRQGRLTDLTVKDLEYIIAACSQIKARVVEFDERETKGYRTILNFGHTVGHALETAGKYSGLSHGEAVSIGMCAAADIAGELGLFGEKDSRRLETLLKALKLPVKAPKTSLKAVLEAFGHDKKFIHGQVRMVLPSRIGHVIVTEDIPKKLIETAIKKRIG